MVPSVRNFRLFFSPAGSKYLKSPIRAKQLSHHMILDLIAVMVFC
jgi:hypothetical protein